MTIAPQGVQDPAYDLLGIDHLLTWETERASK